MKRACSLSGCRGYVRHRRSLPHGTFLLSGKKSLLSLGLLQSLYKSKLMEWTFRYAGAVEDGVSGKSFRTFSYLECPQCRSRFSAIYLSIHLLQVLSLYSSCLTTDRYSCLVKQSGNMPYSISLLSFLLDDDVMATGFSNWRNIYAE